MAASFSFSSHFCMSHAHTDVQTCTKTHTVDTWRFLSAAGWFPGMAHMKCSLNCRFLIGVIIQAYMHRRKGPDFSPESSLPTFLPATSAGYCCEFEIIMDSPICFTSSLTYLMLKVFSTMSLSKLWKVYIICNVKYFYCMNCYPQLCFRCAPIPKRLSLNPITASVHLLLIT